MSGISNVLLVGLFLLTANWNTLRAYMQHRPQPSQQQQTTMSRSADPMAYSRMMRGDNEAWVRGVQSSFKGSLTLTRKTARYWPDEQGGDGSADEFGRGPEASGDFGPESGSGERIAPILTRDRSSGQIKIGNFKSMSFVGEADECLDMGYSMLNDAGFSSDMLDVMAASDEITVAKICASNGTVIMSCRAGQIAISSRRPRPDDNCQPGYRKAGL